MPRRATKTPTVSKATKRPIKDISTSTTMEDLRRLSDEAVDTYSDCTDTLPIKAIHVADKVFQWRDREQNFVADREHTKDLMRIVAEGKPLDPILVTPVGTKVFLVDGHHRLAAYRSQAWKAPVPVKWCLTSIDEACKEALAENSKNKLPMTKGERMEAAWKLVKTTPDGNRPGGLSKEKLSELAGVSPQQIALMRKEWKADPEGLQGATWRDVRRGRWTPDEAFDRDGWRAAEVAKMRDVIDKHLYKAIRKSPDILCDALEALDPSLPAKIIEYWLEEAREAVEDYDAEVTETGLDI